jgi:hypothetical protein
MEMRKQRSSISNRKKDRRIEKAEEDITMIDKVEEDTIMIDKVTTPVEDNTIEIVIEVTAKVVVTLIKVVTVMEESTKTMEITKIGTINLPQKKNKRWRQRNWVLASKDQNHHSSTLKRRKVPLKRLKEKNTEL